MFGIVAAEPGVVLGTPPPETNTLDAPGPDGETTGFPPTEVAPSTPVVPIRVPVALSGTVFCKVDAGYGSIRPGDLLTTSPTAGHAMRADDPHIRTVLGKALAPMDTGTGLIKVLVMLR